MNPLLSNHKIIMANSNNESINPADIFEDIGDGEVGLKANVSIKQNLILASKTTEIQTNFAKNIVAGTEKQAVQIQKPEAPVLMYKAAMSNPSPDSDLTVKLFNRRTFTESGTAQGADDNTHITLGAIANPTDDYYNGYEITITAGTGAGQTRYIIDYDGATVKAQISEAWDTNPDETSEYSIQLIIDSLAWTGNFSKASSTSPVIKANDTDIITGLFDDGCDVYYVVSNDTTIPDLDESRFTAIFQLIPIA